MTTARDSETYRPAPNPGGAMSQTTTYSTTPMALPVAFFSHGGVTQPPADLPPDGSSI